MKRKVPGLGALILALGGTVLCGCSIRRMAINKIGDALASGGSTYESDDDLELVGSALPFGLKMVESLLSEAPRHRGLLLSACQGFTTYSVLYVRQEADQVAGRDLAAAEKLRTRSRRLFLRAHRYGFRALETASPGISGQMTVDPKAALSRLRKKSDVDLLYWNAAALGLAITVSKNDASMLARLPEVEALIGRALELDESWGQGALHEFQVILAGAKPGKPDFDRIETHYRRALALSAGTRASAYVAYAESVAVPKQDHAAFRAAVESALAINTDQYPKVSLANLAAQRRASWLLDRMDDLILPPAPANEENK